MPNDAELLQRYAQGGSDEAFSELVGRHLDLVYSAALRHADGDTALTEDITQCVFTEVARKASRLSRHPALSGWLYTCVHHVAANLRRAERRRRQRERAACTMNDLHPADADVPLWEQMRPVLDDAMHDLSTKDRTAVILRFFEGRSLRDVGRALGLKENSARMRVDRAVERLRRLLARRGVTSTISGLTAALGAGAVLGAPTGLAATVSGAALAHAGVGTATTTFVLWQIMNVTKAKIGLAAVLVTAGIGVPVWQQSQMTRLRTENQTLQAEVAGQRTLSSRAPQRLEAANSNEVARLRQSEQELKLQVAQLRNQLATTSARAAARAAALTPARQTQREPVTNVISSVFHAAVTRAMERALEQQTLAKIPRLKNKLNLSPEQEEAVRKIMLQKMDRAREMAQKILAGHLTGEDLEKKQRMSPSAEEQLKALLSPDQLAAYDEYEQDEVRSQARLVANAELLQMQGVLGLSEEQQDVVFAALYDHTVARMNGELSQTKPQTEDMAAIERWVMEERLKALEPVLTPEQLAQYRQIQENRAQLTQSILQTKGDDTAP